MNIILTRIYEKLEENELTGMELCRRAGIAYSTWSMWKKRDSYPGSEHLGNIAKALGTTTEYLLNGEEEQIIEIKKEVSPERQFERLFTYWTLLNKQQQQQLADFAEFLSGRGGH